MKAHRGNLRPVRDRAPPLPPNRVEGPGAQVPVAVRWAGPPSLPPDDPRAPGPPYPVFMNDYRPPVLAAVLAGAAVLGLYILTLAPTTAFWDASEYIATAHILGIPHPPGNPLFVVLAKVWTLLLAPTGLSVAVRVNLFAAATTAVACGFLFLVAHRILLEVVEDRRVALVGAGVSVLLGATAFTVWNQSNVNEKVYTVSVMILAIVSWLALLWRDQRHDPRSARWLILALYLMVLGSTNHLMSLLPAPALVLFILLVGPAVLLRGDVWAKAIPAILLGLSFNFVLPIRADQRPVINEGDPLCQGAVETAVAVFSKGRLGGCPALASVLLREQYSKPSVLSDPTSDPFNPRPRTAALMGHQLLNYFQYFDWQWARGLDPSEVPGNARLPISLLFIGLGFLGLAASARAHRHIFVYMGATAAVLTVGLVFYLNFRYGFSLAPHITDRAAHEVRERDYFFIASFLVWGVLAGMGLTLLWWELARRAGQGSRGLLTASPILAVALIPLAFNWGWATRAGDHAARSWAYNLLMSVEPYGVIFTNGDNDTFPLWYLQEVEGIRKDVTVVVVQYLYTTWYPKQLQELTDPSRQRPFLPEQDAGLYDAPPLPGAAILSLSPEQMDAVGTTRLTQDFTVPLGGLAVQYPAGMVLNRGQLLALTIIRDSAHERPIHFSSVAGVLADLGLDPWSVRLGMSMKLVPDDPANDPERYSRIAAQLGGDWVDWERTRHLAENVFVYDGLRDRAIWADRASLNIPWHYYFLYLTLADVADRRGLDDTTVEEYAREADLYQVVANGGHRGTPR